MENEQELVQTTERTVGAVRNLTVKDRLTYEAMAEYVLQLRKMVKYFEDLYRPRIKQADEVTKALREDMRKLQQPALDAQKYGDGQLIAWDAEQQRKAREEQLQLAAIQKKKEEDERLQLAALAEKAGEPELAEQIINTPSPEPTIVVQADVPNVSGLSYRDDWHFDVIDANLIPRDYLMIDESKIGKIVRALKRTTNIPGIRVYSIKVPIGRS